jgi:hypothetical protein
VGGRVTELPSTDRGLAHWRLHSLGLDGRTWPTVPDVVAGLLAVQAENHAQASWALATRTPGATPDDVAAALDTGEILRTHVLRPTWHYVRPDDVRWLLELTGPRLLPIVRRAQEDLGTDDAALDRAAGVIEDSLAGGAALTRAALAARLADAGLPTEGQRLGLLLSHAELTGLVCSGPMADGEHTWALLAERAPHARRLDRDEALAELARRYVAGHGPVTERDLAYWATLTLTDARAGLEAAGADLDHFDHDGRRYWFRPPPPAVGDTYEPRAHLLQVLDEYHNGVQDSRHLLDAAALRPAGRGRTVGMALVDGQVVGGMRRTLRRAEVVFDVHLLRDLTPDEAATLQAAAARYGAFLGLPARLEARPPR